MTRDFLLFYDHACHALTWQKTVQMGQACEASGLSLHASPVAATVASTKVGARSLDECTHASVDNTVAPVWQQSARIERVKYAAHTVTKILFREFSYPRKQVERPLDSATEFSSVDSARAAAVLQVDKQRQFSWRCRKFCYAKFFWTSRRYVL